MFAPLRKYAPTSRKIKIFPKIIHNYMSFNLLQGASVASSPLEIQNTLCVPYSLQSVWQYKMRIASMTGFGSSATQYAQSVHGVEGASDVPETRSFGSPACSARSSGYRCRPAQLYAVWHRFIHSCFKRAGFGF